MFKYLTTLLGLACLSLLGPRVVLAQPQIPTLQVCNQTKVAVNDAAFDVSGQSGPGYGGTFKMKAELRCNSRTGSPDGKIAVKMDLNDPGSFGYWQSDALHQITTTGKATPTTWISGTCRIWKRRDIIASDKPLPVPRGLPCRFWMMLVDNGSPYETRRGTPDIAGFLVFDSTGRRIAYGTGTAFEGDIKIDSSAE